MQFLTITDERTGVRTIFGPGFTGPDGSSIECARWPRTARWMPSVEDHRDKGPARTPPVKRHFWPQPSSPQESP